MSHYIYLYFVNFSWQLYMLEWIFTGQLERRPHFYARLAAIAAAYLAGGYLLIAGVQRIPANYYMAAVPYYLGLFGISLLVLKALWVTGFKDVLFIGTAGYALQHISYSVRCIVSALIPLAGEPAATHLSQIHDHTSVISYVLVAVVAYLILARPSAYREQIKSVSLEMVLLSMTVLLISCVLSVLATAQTGGTLLNAICSMYAIVSCLLGLTVQFDIARYNRLETDNLILEQLLAQERRQHEISKENIDLINMKCHDLKHEIKALEQVDNRAMRTRLIDEMNEHIMIYDSTVKSGNDTIDLILTEKSLICQKERIKFSYIIDGSRLAFMDVADMYVLFGNALDNAIEAVRQEPEERRIISLNIQQTGEMLLIHLENYCSRSVLFTDGLPETAKEDKANHGFGTRSIRYLVEKYHGFVEMRQDEDKFILEILFSRS